jgi:uncharacterized SAM-binding protein YcdF (DUF218 family)
VDIDVGTRGLLKLILLPPGSLLILLLIGWLFARRFVGRLLILLATVALYLLSTPAAVAWLATQVETVPALTAEELTHSDADAILVLMAGLRRINPELDGAPSLSAPSLERLDYALSLHRRTGLPIIISGGSVKGDTRPLAELGSEWLENRVGVTPLALDATSRDTWENAHNSAEILQRLGLERVLLVTHAAHMPRAMLSMRAARVDAIAAPFGFEHAPEALRAPLTVNDWLPQPGYLGRSYLLLHEMAGLFWYGLTRL